jgi:hypothetical protein
MLFAQLILLAASLAACTAGSNNPTKIPMMAMTTKSSTNVNPRRENRIFFDNDLIFKAPRLIYTFLNCLLITTENYRSLGVGK